MARARFPGRSSQQNGPRRRVWLPADQFEECSLFVRKEAAVAIRTSKNFGVLFTTSSKSPESLRRLSSCLGESVYAVSKRLRAFSAPAGDECADRDPSQGRPAPTAPMSRHSPERLGRPAKRSPTAPDQSFSASEAQPKRGRTVAAASRTGSETGSEASSEGGRRTRASAGLSGQSASPAPSCASSAGGSEAADAAAAGRPRRSAATSPAGGSRPPEAAMVRTRSSPAADPLPAPAPLPTAVPAGTVVTRSSRVVRPSRRFVDDNAMLAVAIPAPPPPPPPEPEPTRQTRPTRALSPTSDQELDEGVIKNVVEYADSMAAVSGRGGATVAPPPADEPTSDIEAMLRAQWDGRLKGRAGKEEDAVPPHNRHVLRQPRLHLNNRVLKRLRDGRDLTYLSEQEDASAEQTEAAASSAVSANTSGGGYVTCGPCGARRYVAVPSLCYKFGSWVCLHCIKFILMTLKQATPALKCLDSKPGCRVRCDDGETESTAPEKRCHACWLQACLNALNFSEERHNRLRSSLPRAHQATVPLFSRKRRQETGSCEYGPLRPAPPAGPAPSAALTSVSVAPPAACSDKAWGAAAAPGFDALSRPAVDQEPARPTQLRRERRLNLPAGAPPHCRKAVTVIALGDGWKRREFVRKGGRLDRVVYTPDGCRFKSVVELQAYLRTSDVTRRAKSFFTDGPAPTEPKPAPTRRSEPEVKPKPEPEAAPAPALANDVRTDAAQQESSAVVRDSFVKRGPRVKLVCRSASLVLGQPRATFGDSPPPAAQQPPEPPPPLVGKENRAAGATREVWPVMQRHTRLNKRRRHAGDDKPSSRNVLMKLKVLHKYKQLQQSRGKERMRKSRCAVCPGCKAKNCTKCIFCKDMVKYGGPGRLKKSCIRRVCNRPLLPGLTTLKQAVTPAADGGGGGTATASPDEPDLASATATQSPPPSGRQSSQQVRLDYWTTPDPAHMWQQGVALLAAQPPGVPVLCFVCASAGIEEMLYCNACCEPYHPFCLEEGDVPRSAAHQENWLCRRCQVCCVCGASPPDRPLHRCHQCNETYHLSCLGPHACAPPARFAQPWMAGWPYAPAGPHATPVRAEPLAPAQRQLAPLGCTWCTDLPKVEDPAQGLRPPVPWQPPDSAPLRLHWDELLPRTCPAAVAADAGQSPAASDAAQSDDEAFAGFASHEVAGAAPCLDDMIAIVDEADVAQKTPPPHRKHKKRRRKSMGWNRTHRKRKWRLVGPGSRSEAAKAARAALAAGAPANALRSTKSKSKPEPEPVSEPEPEPLPTLYSLPLQYRIVDQAEALQMLYDGMNTPCMSGEQLERIGLQYGPLAQYREQGDLDDAGSDTDTDTDADHLPPLTVLDFLREVVDAELEALGYPPPTRPFVLGGERRPLRCADAGSERHATRRTPYTAAQQRRLPDGMTETEWEWWRRRLPTRKGRPRKYPRQDDLQLIHQLKQGKVDLPLNISSEAFHRPSVFDTGTPRARPGARRSPSASRAAAADGGADGEVDSEPDSGSDGQSEPDGSDTDGQPTAGGDCGSPQQCHGRYVTYDDGVTDDSSCRPSSAELKAARGRQADMDPLDDELDLLEAMEAVSDPMCLAEWQVKRESLSTDAGWQDGFPPAVGPRRRLDLSGGPAAERASESGSPPAWCADLIGAVSDVSDDPPPDGSQNGDARHSEGDDDALLDALVDVKLLPDTPPGGGPAHGRSVDADPYAKTYSTGASRRRGSTGS